jgi:exopolyphosphatase/guanosine-5'-triphosphate,3'-diphosphate pyrophosphatase
MSGEDEARLTFLAVRRWFGWSSGRLAVFDIGGGSLEVAGGDDESPDVAWSLPLGAGRLSRDHFVDGPPSDKALAKLRKQIRTAIAHDAGTLLRGGAPDHAVATSKTFRSLARICGAAASNEGPLVRRILPAVELEEWIPKLLAMSQDDIADLPGVSSNRAHQVVAGALVASAVMDIFDLEELEICPWALREGVILDRLDQLSALG